MKYRLLALFLAAALPAAQAADDTELRLRRLESEVGRLHDRIALLERLLLQREQDSGSHVYVCRINAFTRVYEGESPNAGLAKRRAQTACEKEQAAMFCRAEEIRCVRY